MAASLSAVLGILTSAGDRIDKLLAVGRSYLPTWIKLGTGITGSAARNGPIVEVTLAVDTSTIATKAYAEAQASSAGNVVEALGGASVITLQHGLQIYSGSASTSDTTPTTLISIPVADGELVWLRISIVGESAGTYFASAGESVKVRSGASLVAKKGAAPFTDLDEIGIGGAGISLVGENVEIGVIGKAATNITWRASAMVMVK